MQSLKVLIVGPFGAGKTTLIKSISEITVLSTERQVSDPTGRGGADTVAMDFGRVTISDDIVLYLFGTPGQERYSFMWDTLAEGMLGFIVLIDGSSRASITEAREILEFFAGMEGVAYIVAANRLLVEDEKTMSELRNDLALDPSIPLIGVDVRDRASAKSVILALLRHVLAGIDA